jgi:hypothetical protein
MCYKLFINFRIGSSCPHNYNPADFFIQMLAIVPKKEIACRYIVNSVCNTYEDSDIGKNILNKIKLINIYEDEIVNTETYIFDEKLKYKANYYEQFRAVLWRSWISVIKEPILIKVRLLQTVVSILQAYNILLYYLIKKYIFC